MKDQEFDRILSGDAELVPSSGFASVVMDAVRQEASAPPPIPFPWKRALPGIAALVVAVVYLFMEAFRQSAPTAAVPPPVTHPFSALVPAFQAAQMVGAGWILGALLLAWLCVKLSLLFAQRRA